MHIACSAAPPAALSALAATLTPTALFDDKAAVAEATARARAAGEMKRDDPLRGRARGHGGCAARARVRERGERVGRCVLHDRSGRADLERSDFAVRRVPLIFAWK